MIALVVLLLSFPSVYAQEKQGSISAEFSMGSGPIIQPGNLKDYFNTGFSLQTGLKADVSKFISFRLGLRYLPLKLDTSYVAENLNPERVEAFKSITFNGGTRHSLIGGLDMLVYFNGPERTVRPYLFVGGGYSLILKKDIVIQEVIANGTEFESPLEFTENEHYPAVNAGLGLDGGWVNTRYYFEIEYLVMLSEELDSGWQDDSVEHNIYSPHDVSQMLFIHGGLRFRL